MKMKLLWKFGLAVLTMALTNAVSAEQLVTVLEQEVVVAASADPSNPNIVQTPATLIVSNKAAAPKPTSRYPNEDYAIWSYELRPMPLQGIEGL